MKLRTRQENREYMRKYRAEHPERQRATELLALAVKKGEVERQPCEACGSENARAYHADYSKPLKVSWLCLKCRRKPSVSGNRQGFPVQTPCGESGDRGRGDTNAQMTLIPSEAVAKEVVEDAEAGPETYIPTGNDNILMIHRDRKRKYRTILVETASDKTFALLESLGYRRAPRKKGV